MSKKSKIANEVYVKHFGIKLEIENHFVFRDEGARYVYQISYEETAYILKGFRIRIDQINPQNEKSAELFMQSLEQINEVLQEYHLARVASLINPHIVKPLSLDFMIDVAKDSGSFPYLHIQIIFEHNGIALDELQSMTITHIYNLMRQSANALYMLHNLEIGHFDIKPANMVYDGRKDLLKIIDMGSAYGSSNQKKFGSTTKTLAKKVTSFTPEFAPPEVLLMNKGTLKDLKLSLPAIDVYYWGMSFFAILTKRDNSDLRGYVEMYKERSKADYKEFKKIVETTLNSVKAEDSKEQDLKKLVSDLLTKALEYEPKERPTVIDLISQMNKFEKEKEYRLDYSKAELRYNKDSIKLLVHNTEDVNSLKELLNKNRDKEDVKIIDTLVIDSPISLSCNHEVEKDQVINYALKLFVNKERYKHSYLCKVCEKIVKLKCIPLSCGCVWTKFGEEIKYDNCLTKASYGKCSKDHPLTSIDIGLVNDFISAKFTSLIISEYAGKKEELVNSLSDLLRRESVTDALWIVKHTKIITKLELGWKKLGPRDAKVISELLKTDTRLIELNLYGNSIRDEGAKAICKALKTNTTLKNLLLWGNSIGLEGMKAISKLLKVNKVLTQLGIGYNDARTEGAKIIGEALKDNSTLKKLLIISNELRVEGTINITEALKSNKGLTELFLCDNEIGDGGMEAINKLLENNTTLEKLYLTSNNITDEGIKVIYKALEVNNTLKELQLLGNRLKEEGKNLLKKVQENHTYINIFY